MTVATRNKPYPMPFGVGGQGGSMLIVIVIILLLMSVLIGFMLDFTTTSIFGELTYNQMERAFYMAEAGGHYACPLVKQDIESDATYDDTYLLHNQTVTLDDGGTEEGRFTLSVDDTDPSNTRVYSTGVVSTGLFSNAEVKLAYSMAKTSSVFGTALFTEGEMSLGKNVTINGDVGTNAPSITKDSGVTITGTEETGVGTTLDPITFSCGGCSGDVEISGNETWSSGTYEYGSVTINKNNTLTIDGDVILYVAADFVAEMNTAIELSADSSLTIYVDGTALFDKNFEVVFVPQPDRPEDVVIYGTSNADTITFDQNVIFIGAIYAPGADIQSDFNLRYTGAIIGDTVTLGRNSIVTYDSDVLDIATPVVGGGSVVLGTPVQYFSY